MIGSSARLCRECRLLSLRCFEMLDRAVVDMQRVSPVSWGPNSSLVKQGCPYHGGVATREAGGVVPQAVTYDRAPLWRKELL
jgi:hypothetical protein